MKNEKIVKTSVVVDRILKILQGFFLAGMIVSAIFIPLTAVLGEKIIANASSLVLGNLTVELAGDFRSYLDHGSLKTCIIVYLAASILGLGVGWLCLKKLREILAPMKEGRPFEAGIASQIRQLALILFIGGGVSEVGRAVGTVFELKAYDLQRLFDLSAVETITYNYDIRLWFVLVALILLFLSYVFRCGEDLQRESDETL